jgi:vacuolar protein sorting-associated protein 13A/C
LKTKLKRLQLAELFVRKRDSNESALSAEEEETEENQGGFASRLLAKLLDNIQLFIDVVHIRYEDDLTDPEVWLCFTCVCVCVCAHPCACL